MFSQLHDRIIEFINSEEGKVGVKTSLSLGLVGGGILLMQTIFPSTADAKIECWNDSERMTKYVTFGKMSMISGTLNVEFHK